VKPDAIGPQADARPQLEHCRLEQRLARAVPEGKPNSRRISAGSNPVEISFTVSARSIRVPVLVGSPREPDRAGVFDPLRRCSG
jgi:hypothetical protein